MPSPSSISSYAPVKANRLIKENVKALLLVQGKTRKDLAQWCYKSESWISKILKEDRREFPVSGLDRVADFFGLATYQLFQPGIASGSERRRSVDRRAGKERRMSHAQRELLRLSHAIDPFRPGKSRDVDPSPYAVALRALTEEHERKVSALIARAESGGQDAAPRARVPPTPKSRRDLRRSDPAAS